MTKIKSTEDYIRQFLNAVASTESESIQANHIDWMRQEAKALLGMMGPSVPELQSQAESLEVYEDAPEEPEDLRSEWQKQSEPDPLPMLAGDKEVVSRTLKNIHRPINLIGQSSHKLAHAEVALRDYMQSKDYKDKPGGYFTGLRSTEDPEEQKVIDRPGHQSIDSDD